MALRQSHWNGSPTPRNARLTDPSKMSRFESARRVDGKDDNHRVEDWVAIEQILRDWPCKHVREFTGRRPASTGRSQAA
jgi:hypothetical protein